ncbi:adenosine kinase-like [Aphis craccivora]|uniref:Adenosine kinase-like n=1 Tax=Aphis craccivora TaxID=307492 RepID=A0A6G0ZQN6_APHCR|nr:adenosine kinase-like [Aphis craccivora]
MCERRERRAVGKDNSSGGGGGDGLQDTSAVIGHQLVGRYFTDWYNALQNVWRYYTEDAVCSLDVDGTKYVATGRTEIRELFNDLTAPETGNHEDDDGECRSLVVQSIVTVRCPSGKLLVVATTDRFTQTFVVEYTAPDLALAGVASVVVVASVVTVKTSWRLSADAAVAESQGADEDSAVASTATGPVWKTGGVIQICGFDRFEMFSRLLHLFTFWQKQIRNLSIVLMTHLVNQ